MQTTTLAQLEQHFVIADHSRRKSIILEQIQSLAKQEKASADVNDRVVR